MSLLKDSFVNVAGRLVAIFSTFISIFLLGRLFSVENFGFWTWLFSIFSLINAQDFGFIAAMRVKIGEFFSVDNEAPQKLWFISGLTLSVLTVIFLMLGYAFYGEVLMGLGHEQFVASTVVVACSLFTVLGMCFSHALMACLKSVWVGLAEGLRALLQVTALTLAYLLDAGFMETLVLFYGLTALYTPLVALIFLKSKGWSIPALFMMAFSDVQAFIAALGVLLRKGWILWLTQVGLALLSISDVFLAGFFLPESEVAYVNVLSRLVLVGVGIIGAALIPAPGHFVHSMRLWNRSQALKKLIRFVTLLFGVGLVYSTFLIVFGEKLVLWWSTLLIDNSIGFFMAGMLFTVMASVTLLQVFVQFSLYARAIMPSLFVCIVIKIVMTAWFTGIFGYLGVFYASFLATLVFFVLNLYYLFVLGYFSRILKGQQSLGLKA